MPVTNDDFNNLRCSFILDLKPSLHHWLQVIFHTREFEKLDFSSWLIIEVMVVNVVNPIAFGLSFQHTPSFSAWCRRFHKQKNSSGTQMLFVLMWTAPLSKRKALTNWPSSAVWGMQSLRCKWHLYIDLHISVHREKYFVQKQLALKSLTFLPCFFFLPQDSQSNGWLGHL